MPSGQVGDVVDPVETWRNIPGQRGYQVSSLARFRSVPRRLSDGRTAGGVVLAQQDDKDSYPTVKIRGKRYRVNVLVQLAFAGPPEVRHLDGDRSNCKPGNLAYGSRVQNEQDKAESGKLFRKEDGCSRPFPVGTSPVTAVTDAV